jgi:hypothetical protein
LGSPAVTSLQPEIGWSALSVAGRMLHADEGNAAEERTTMARRRRMMTSS